eukprot:225873-Pyramimonas_sp.AAC.1
MGSFVLKPLKSHTAVMQQRIFGWMEPLDLGVLSTFPRQGGADLSPAEFWTCERNGAQCSDRRLI